MGTISSGVGLVSGINSAKIIDQLIALQSRPIRLIDQRIAGLTNQQTGLLSISAYLLSVENLARGFGGSGAFDVRAVTASAPDVLRATASAGAPVGTFTFTVAQLVQSHQMVSRGFADRDRTPVGAGTITIEIGQGFLNRDTPVSFLNGQTGFDRGAVRITDRSGATATIDLTDAVTVADILDRINTNGTVSVTASVQGDRIVLADRTGQTASNLIVADVGTDRTATTLGIAASVAQDSVTGSALVRVTTDTPLSLLNDGNGVRTVFGFDDFRITQRDGSTIDVRLSAARTLGDVLQAINTDDDNTGDLVAQVAADGVSIELVDSSTGGSALTVTALNGSAAASDLGLLKSVSGGGGTLAGDRVVAGLNTVLLRSLAGGAGVTPGEIRIVDRAGTESVVDLTGAQTIQDVIDRVNGAAVAAQVTASLNAAGNGLRITDTSGSALNPLVITNSGGSNTATDLGIDTGEGGIAASAVEGSDLELRYVSETTALADLNGGTGIARGKFTITDSTGKVATVDLTQGTETTIGDVLREINSRGLSVVASVNATGDGILLTDTGGGTGRLTVAEVGTGRTAASLGLLGQAAEGEPFIDGSFEVEIEIDADDTLKDVARKLTDAGAPLTATVMNDGSPGTPWRLSLVSEYGGRLGRLLVDARGPALSLSTLIEGRDATLLVGRAAGGPDPVVITSHCNTVTGVLDKVALDLVSASPSPVTVSIRSDTETLVRQARQLVDAVNAAVAGIDQLIAYDAQTKTTGVLQGDVTAQRVRSQLLNLVSRSYAGVGGSYTSLREIGIRIGENGRVTFDEDRFRQRLSNGFAQVRALFTADGVGVADVFENVLHSFTSDNPGLIENRVGSIGTRIDLLTRQKEQYQARVDAERRRLELEFARLETIMAQLQDQSRAMSALQLVPATTRRSGASLFG